MNCQKEALPLPNLSGQCINGGRLRLIELIGFGASGTVYLAIDLRSDPVYYAVKCLPNAGLSRDSLLWQKREIECHWLVSRSSSPHICKLHQTIEEGPYMFLVLDYCPGGDLFTAINSRMYEGNVPLIKKAFIELLDGVHVCHTAGVYHRDLKPENILCVESGLGIRIADFGLSTTKTISQEFNVGSLGYFSPECHRDSGSPHYSPLHSDIWSLGIILLDMVLNRSPWRSAESSDQDFQKYIDNPNFFLEVFPISRSLNEILKQIFRLQEYDRISLPRLREEILTLDTFYRNEAELCNASKNARELPTFPSHPAMAGYTCVDVSDSCAENEAPWSPALSRCSTCSFSESDGPITPETRPHEPMTESSDMPSRKGHVYYSLPLPSYIHAGCLCEICLPLLSPKIGTDFDIPNRAIVDTGGMMQTVSTI
ncbi:serine/threonine protein kinase, negative regulator of sexual conjugation and meiosis [Suillus lakei]|nr:serine/threonine protein kinase, negative regulator of sexual conjugation and meiosis [Suillus lakei]